MTKPCAFQGHARAGQTLFSWTHIPFHGCYTLATLNAILIFPVCMFAHTLQDTPTFQSTASVSPLVWSPPVFPFLLPHKNKLGSFKLRNILNLLLVNFVMFCLVSLIYLSKLTWLILKKKIFFGNQLEKKRPKV